MGILAEQLINGTSSIVIFRSRSEDRVRVAIIAGTEQPKPISIGTKLRPESPMRRRSLSMTNATRDMYPVSSSIARKKNSTTIRGRKLSILPTPANTPSITRLCTTGFKPYAVSRPSTHAVKLSIPIASRSDSHLPKTLKVIQKMKAIIAMKVGMARYLLVRILSILTLRSISLLS